MPYKIVGKSVQRGDAVAKVTGRAKYTGDIPVNNLLYGKIRRADIAHGFVKKLDISEALLVPGVVKILTPEDLPEAKFPTAGHPYVLAGKGGDISDRNILTRKIRLCGDEIAAVIADNPLAAEIAADKIKAEYEELPFYLTTEEALHEDAAEIHKGTKNILADTLMTAGDIENGFSESDYIIESQYQTQIVQHCHLESQIAYAYQDADGRWVCVSSTQIPHIVRRILGQAFELPWGRFRVVKPYIGGGFGNKQDVTIEPLVVAMSMAVAGRPVQLSLTREESLAFTRVRHAISYDCKMGVSKDGKILAMKMEAVANNGAYASHGHAICAKGGGTILTLYDIPNFEYRAKTVYTNTATAGAMRGYGVPQVTFATEALVDKACKELGFDPIEFRLKNMTKEGIKHPKSGLTVHTNKIQDCIVKGREKFGWDEKKKNAQEYKAGDLRRGLGLAAFAYATGVYPISMEISGCRLTLNQDGTVKMLVGATEIGQGSDTVFRQMAAEVLGIAYDEVYADGITDTDYAPFDTGAYASRQTYVTGNAVKKAALELKKKILIAAGRFYDIPCDRIHIENSKLIDCATGEVIESLGDLALKTYYDLDSALALSAEVSENTHNANYPMGVTFAEVEVDIKTGKARVLSLLNMHDSGTIINPLLATGQVEGGMGMGVSYALGEELRYDGKTGAPLNNNLLDYKMPTMMDVPDLDCGFVEAEDPTGPFGNKGLGEPPLCSPAAAIRNAVADALGFGINSLPLSAQKIFEAMQQSRVALEESLRCSARQPGLVAQEEHLRCSAMQPGGEENV